MFKTTSQSFILLALLTSAWIRPAVAQEPALVADIAPGILDSIPDSYTDVAGVTFFSAMTGGNDRELYNTDGTPAGTELVRNIHPFAGSIRSGEPFGTLGSLLIFPASDGVNGRELWRSDGTEAGTVLIKDIKPGSGDGFVVRTHFVEAGGLLFFLAEDGVNGRELWRTDGTEAGTVLVKDINPGTANSNPGLTPSSSIAEALVALGSDLIFVADDGVNGTSLWKSNGTEAGTELLASFNVGSAFLASAPSELTLFQGHVYFPANDVDPAGNIGIELWRTDGTVLGTGVFADLYAGSLGSRPQQLTAAEGLLYFVAEAPNTHLELWKSDGTLAGTEMVLDVRPGGFSSNIKQLTAVGDLAFFWADDGVNGTEIWRSDGTDTGTFLLKDFVVGGSSAPLAITSFDGSAYFGANDLISGRELWTSDGTEAGTLLVYDLDPGADFSLHLDGLVTALNDKLFFTATDGVVGVEAWMLQSVSAPVATSLVLTPQTATTEAGTQHCVVATVSDQGGAPMGGVDVGFLVTGATTAFEQGATTAANGEAQLCYVGSSPGADTIEACVGESPIADWNDCALNGVYDSADNTWTLVPTALTLEPNAAVNLVGDEHCVVATVLDQFSAFLSGVTVTFAVTGANPTLADVPIDTDINGEAELCYVGNNLGSDTIEASVDGLDPVTATKTWEEPAPPPPGEVANLGVSISADVSTVPTQTDGALPVEIVVSNQGPDTATGVVLVVRLPGGVTFESATDASLLPLNCTSQGRNLTCELGALAAGSDFFAEVVMGTKGGNALTTSASVAAIEDDPDLQDNSDSVTVDVCRRDCP